VSVKYTAAAVFGPKKVLLLWKRRGYRKRIGAKLKYINIGYHYKENYCKESEMYYSSLQPDEWKQPVLRNQVQGAFSCRFSSTDPVLGSAPD
jgi:hypothetical protein